MIRRTPKYRRIIAKRLKLRRIKSQLNSSRLPNTQMLRSCKGYQQVQDVSVTVGSNNSALFNKLAERKPVKLIRLSMPIFKFPAKVDVLFQAPWSKSARQKECQIAEIEEEGNPVNVIDFEAFKKYKGDLNLSIQQMKLQTESVHLPSFVAQYFKRTKAGITNNNIQAVNLWYYKQQSTSTWHYDGHDNFLFILQGNKIVYLAPPHTVQHHTLNDPLHSKSKNVFDSNANHASTKAFQDFTSQQKYKVEVKEKECLFIPRGWWHYVESRGSPNIAINVWGNSLRRQVELCEEEAMLKHLIFQVSERMALETVGWSQLPQQWRVKYRQAYFMAYLRRLSNEGV